MKANGISDSFSHQHILLVDDDVTLGKLTSKILQHLGYPVVYASSPESVLVMEEAELAQVKLLITDVMMPQINGVSLAAKIKTKFPAVRCLYVSAHSSNILSQLKNTVDKWGFLQKPYSANELALAVREQLES